MTLSIPLPSPGVRRDDLFTPIAELLPLPQETYPRIFDKRKPDKGYYIALCLVLSLWVLTPFSWYRVPSPQRMKVAESVAYTYYGSPSLVPVFPVEQD